LLGQAKLKLMVFVPEIYNGCICSSQLSSYARAHVEQYEYRTTYLGVSGMSSSEYNAGKIRAAPLAVDLSPGEKVVLIVHTEPLSVQEQNQLPRINSKVKCLMPISGIRYFNFTKYF
jgi:hypothetical protein